MPPNCRTITRLTGSVSPDWRLFTDGGFERQVDGSDLAGWGIAAVSPDNVVRLLCGPVVCVILAIWHFQEPPRAATALRNSLVLRSSQMDLFFHPSRRKGTFFVQIQSTRLVLPSVLITPEETLLQLANATNSCCVRSAFFHILFHHVFSRAGNAGSRRSCPTRSSRMFTPRCGGKKRGTLV